MIFTDFEIHAVFQRDRHLDNLTEQFDYNVIDYIHVRVLLDGLTLILFRLSSQI